MTIIPTTIEGLYIIEPQVFGDSRGYFFESFNKKSFIHAMSKVHAVVAPEAVVSPESAAATEAVVATDFVQDNESKSSYGVIRGLHFQRPPHAQSKLVRCVRGSVVDVVVDLRKSSKTYGQHFKIELSEENHRQLYIPKGLAHGFSVVSESAVFLYKCDEFYVPGSEDGIDLMDKDLAIDWEIPQDKAILSAKDLNRQSFKDFVTPFE